MRLVPTAVMSVQLPEHLSEATVPLAILPEEVPCEDERKRREEGRGDISKGARGEKEEGRGFGGKGKEPTLMLIKCTSLILSVAGWRTHWAAVVE